ncbi:MAG: hypothetical protein EG824_06730 [Deltaproteobacteria bacterium]|nr:hypothetical protein [Deltaproteobacteria bacterium]
MKKILIMAIAVVVVFGLGRLATAETITRIVGSKITVRDAMGKEKTIESTVQGLRVGDKVKLTVRNGRTWLDPQPEPPLPERSKPANLKKSVPQNKVPATPEAPPPPPPPDRPKLN